MAVSDISFPVRVALRSEPAKITRIADAKGVVLCTMLPGFEYLAAGIARDLNEKYGWTTREAQSS